MAPTNRNVIDAQVALVSSTKFENGLRWAWLYNVDNPAIVLLLRQTLEHHIVAFRFVIFDQVIFSAISLHH